MECPVCYTVKNGYVTFRCGHSICNTCVLGIRNHRQQYCPMCRADIVDQIPHDIELEVENERYDVESNAMGSRPRRDGEDGGYSSADEIEEDATHIKIRYGASEVAFIRNDGIDKEITVNIPGTNGFRIVYKNRRCYLIRGEYPDTLVPLNPLSSTCAAIRQPTIT